MALVQLDEVAEYDLVINQGSDFDLDFTLQNDDGTPLCDLTGATGACKARTDFSAASPVIISPTVAVTNGPACTFRVSLTAVQTAGLSRPAGAAVGERTNQLGYYDVEFSLSGKTYRYIQGKFSLSSEETY